jgi:hypothetical protein
MIPHLYIPFHWDPDTDELLNENEILSTGMVSQAQIEKDKIKRREAMKKERERISQPVPDLPTLNGAPVPYKDVRRLFMEAYQKETQKEQPVKTLGLTSMVKALTSGPVDKEEKQRRQEICQECQEQDEGGIRLYREIDGKSYCGEPRLKRILRDEGKNGCGCNLRFKWIFKEAHCPLKKW